MILSDSRKQGHKDSAQGFVNIYPTKTEYLVQERSILCIDSEILYSIGYAQENHEGGSPFYHQKTRTRDSDVHSKKCTLNDAIKLDIAGSKTQRRGIAVPLEESSPRTMREPDDS